MEFVPLVMTIVGAIIVVAGFVYAFTLRKRGGVRIPSRPFWGMILTIGLGTGIFVAGIMTIFF